MVAYRIDQLCGHWIHSFEEDGPDEMVYRPQGFDFPRSRGRRALKLQEDGSVLDLSPGSTDLPQAVAGDWNITAETVNIHYTDGSAEQLPIKEVGPGKLVIRKT